MVVTATRAQAGVRQQIARVVHVTTVPMSLTFLRGQVSYMQQRGLEVIAISSPGAELEQFGTEQQIKVVAVEMPRAITPLRDLKALLELRATFRRLKPDIVHAHTPKGGLLGTLGAALAGVPTRVYHMRGLPMTSQRGLQRHLLRWAERLTCALAHRVLCVSHSLRRIAVAEGLCPESKITTLAAGSGNGVDAQHRFNPAYLPATARDDVRDRYGIPHDAVVIGFIGRLVRDKGVLELLEAFDSITRELPHVHLLMVGMVEQRDALPPNVLNRIANTPCVHWRGADWDTPPIYAAMDIVALPTYREGLPNVPLEAAAMQLPTVATRIPGCTDVIVDGETGTLVPPRDTAALAAALRRYVTNAELRARHGSAARKRVVSAFAQEVIWQALLDEYLALMGSVS